ncbi:hypothetical protein Tco_0537712 [Tanacetum coccineum]
MKEKDVDDVVEEQILTIMLKAKDSSKKLMKYKFKITNAEKAVFKAREVNIKKQQSSDQSELQKDNATESGVFLMMHMEIYYKEIAKNGVWDLQRRTRKKEGDNRSKIDQLDVRDFDVI